MTEMQVLLGVFGVVCTLTGWVARGLWTQAIAPMLWSWYLLSVKKTYEYGKLPLRKRVKLRNDKRLN